MRIVLDLPDWVDERNIRVFAGIELVAKCSPGGLWQIKTARCVQCGRCCTGLRRFHPFPIVDGQCAHLQQQPGKHNKRWLCALGANRPFGCSTATPNADYCSVRYETIED